MNERRFQVDVYNGGAWKQLVAGSAVEERVAVVKPGANHGMPK